MILFRAEAIFASSISKFWKSFPQTDREDFNSSKESTISTSLIHNIASDGKSKDVSPVTFITRTNNRGVLSRWTSSSRLQTGIFPRRRFSRKSERFKSNFRWCVLCLFGSHTHTFVPISALERKKYVYPTAALKLKWNRVMQGYAWRASQQSIFWTQSNRHFAPASWRRLQAYWANTKTKTSRSAWRHGLLTYKRAVIQHANGISSFSKTTKLS